MQDAPYKNDQSPLIRVDENRQVTLRRQSLSRVRHYIQQLKRLATLRHSHRQFAAVNHTLGPGVYTSDRSLQSWYYRNHSRALRWLAMPAPGNNTTLAGFIMHYAALPLMIYGSKGS